MKVPQLWRKIFKTRKSFINLEKNFWKLKKTLDFQENSRTCGKYLSLTRISWLWRKFSFRSNFSTQKASHFWRTSQPWREFLNLVKTFSTQKTSLHCEENFSPLKILECDEISQLRINHSLDEDTALNKKISHMTRFSWLRY